MMMLKKVDKTDKASENQSLIDYHIRHRRYDQRAIKDSLKEILEIE